MLDGVALSPITYIPAFDNYFLMPPVSLFKEPVLG